MVSSYTALYRFARGLCGDPTEADDLVQEAFRRALAAKNAPESGEADEVRRWMFVILRNIWKNEKRRQARDFAVTDSGVELPSRSEHTPEDAAMRKWLQYEIRDALDSLDAMFREVIVLRDLEGLTYAEIAEVADVPLGTVMSRIARGRKQLRKRLAVHAGGRQQESRL